MQKFFVTAVVATTVLIAGAAQATTWECKMNTAGKYNWVPKWILFSDEVFRNKVIAIDNVTYSIGNKQPVMAKVSVNNDKRLTFKWRTGRTGGRSNTGQSGYAVFDMRATFLRSKKKIVMFVNPRGYNNDESSRGLCVPSKQKIR